jgi:hypothetical protein
MRISKYEKILSVATQLIAKKGYAGTSLQDIANEVTLHKSSLFHYFKTKEELLLKILETPIEEVDINLEKIILDKELSIEEKLKRAIDNHLFLLTEHLDIANIYLNETRNLSKKYRSLYLGKRKKYGKNFEKIVVGMKTEGYFKGLDTKIVTFGLLGMLNWVVKWYKRKGVLNVKEIADIFYKMLME